MVLAIPSASIISIRVGCECSRLNSYWESGISSSSLVVFELPSSIMMSSVWCSVKTGKGRSPSDVVASDGPVDVVVTDGSWGSVMSIAWPFDFCRAGVTVSPVGRCLRFMVTIGGGDVLFAMVVKAGDLIM